MRPDRDAAGRGPADADLLQEDRPQEEGREGHEGDQALRRQARGPGGQRLHRLLQGRAGAQAEPAHALAALGAGLYYTILYHAMLCYTILYCTKLNARS